MMKRHANTLGKAAIPVMLCLFFLLLPAALQAGEVTLAWDPNSEENLAGYKLYYDSDADTEMYQGTGANEGDSPVVIYLENLADADSPTYTLTGLTNGLYYYFALTAFDTDGMESDFSDEVGTTVGATSDLAKVVDDTVSTPVDATDSTTVVDDTDSTSVDDTDSTSVDDTDSTSVNDTDSTSIDDTDSTSVDVTDSTSVDVTDSTSVDDTDSTSIDDANSKSVNDIKFILNGSVEKAGNNGCFISGSMDTAHSILPLAGIGVLLFLSAALQARIQKSPFPGNKTG